MGSCGQLWAVVGSCDGVAWTWRACKESESSDDATMRS